MHKIVRASSADSEKYKRFRREIETVRTLSGSGLALLPIYDAALPDDLGSQLAWFSMPEARILNEALKGREAREADLLSRPTGVACNTRRGKSCSRTSAARVHQRDQVIRLDAVPWG
jgi:hypothetical protein